MHVYMYIYTDSSVCLVLASLSDPFTAKQKDQNGWSRVFLLA